MIESLNAIAGAWWGWIFAMLWQVGLLIILIACIDRIIRKWAWPQLRYALWSLILIKLILPPTMSLPSSIVPELRPVVSQALRWVDSEAPAAEKHAVENSALARQVVNSMCNTNGRAIIVAPQLRSGGGGRAIGFDQGVSLDRQNHPQASLEAITLPQSTINRPPLTWHVYAMAIWLAGTLILGIWLLLRLHALAGRSANRAAAASLPQSFYNQMAGCAERLGLWRIPRVVVVRKLATPAVFGVFRPVLLMPKGYLRKLSRKDTEHMLLHELAHIKRGDLHMHGLYMLLQIVYWYNPLLWLVRRQLHHLRELSCDATVANLLREQTIAYRQTLLETARRFLARSTEPGLGLLGLFEDSNRLVVRLNWLAKPTWRYRTMKHVTVVTLATLMFVCVLPMAPGQENTALAVENDTTEQIQNEVPQSQELQELQTKLEKLEVERQKLQIELQALAQARQAAAKAKTHSAKAAAKAGKAKDAAAKASTKAKEAKAKAGQAQMNTHEHQQWAKDMQAWAQQMQQWQESPEMHEWQENLEQWEHSDDFKQWEKDVEKWSEKFAKHYEKAYDADAGSADAAPVTPVAPMPAMPPMPSMPAMPAAPTPSVTPSAMPHPMPLPLPMPMPMPKVKVKPDDGKAKAEAKMHFTSPLIDGGLLIVENRVGAITVRGAATNECRLDILITAKAETKEEAEAMAQAVEMKYNSSDSRIFIKPVKPDNDKWENVDVAFEITVPQRANLQLGTDVGAALLRDVQGQIKVKTNVGAVTTRNVRGDINLETNVGDIQFIAPDDLSAKVTAVTNIGTIQSDLPIEIDGKGQANTGGFGVAMGSRATGTLGTGEGTVTLKSNVGSISVRSKGSADEPVKVKKISSVNVAPTVVTVGDAPGAMVVSGASGRNFVTTVETGITSADRITGTVTLDASPGVRMIESIRETQEGDRHILRRTELETMRLAAGSTVDVANENGTITVIGTDGDTCQVHAIVTVKGPTAETTKKLSKAISLDITPKGKGLGMAVVRPKQMPAGHFYRMDLQIMVPRQTNLNVIHEDGDVKIAEVAGQIKLALEDGAILCERLTGNLNVRLEDGKLKIDQSTFSDCQVAMEDGKIECDNIQGNLDVRLEDGQIKIGYADDLPPDCTIKVVLEDGSIKLSAPSAMFPADGPTKATRRDDGAEWKTTAKTGQGSRTVTLRVGDGSVKVDKR
jgi:beta-lactamase regulating signal transducer with metallopeptidase domain/DUF4097 and DUF4098 domain-containing protein YvlB